MSKEVFCVGQADDGKPVVLTTVNSLGITDADCDIAANALKTLFDSLVNAGFKTSEAIEILIGLVRQKQ